MGVVDQVAVTMKIMITDSVDEGDNGDNDVDENVGDGDPARGCQKIGHLTCFLNYQNVKGNFPRC